MTLQRLCSAVEPVMHRHGLIWTAFVHGNVLCVRVAEVDGTGCIESQAQVPEIAIENPQKMGAFMTYMRRYLLQGILGVAAEKDDVGESEADDDGESLRQAIEDKGAWFKAMRSELAAASDNDERKAIWLKYGAQLQGASKSQLDALRRARP